VPYHKKDIQFVTFDTDSLLQVWLPYVFLSQLLTSLKLLIHEISQIVTNYRYVDEIVKILILQKFNLSCQYMEFVIISDSKTISPRFSHYLSGLEPIFNNFISSNYFF